MSHILAAMLFLSSLCAVVSGSSLNLDATSMASYFEGPEAKKKPIARVVVLLESMNEKLEEDGKADKEMKEKLDCWCATNNADRESAIKASQEKLERLNGFVAEESAKIEQLKTEIRTLTVEVNKHIATRDKANALRADQVEAFKKDEKALLDSISNVAGARESLDKEFAGNNATAPTLVQMESTELKKLSQGLKKVMETTGARLYSSLDRFQRSELDAFMKDPTVLQSAPKGGGSFLQQAAPSTGVIVGILRTMADDFAGDLQKELDEEKANKKSYEELLKAKTAEINAGQASLAQKREANSTSTTNLGKAKKVIKATEKVLQENIEYKAAVGKRCDGKDTKYEARVAARGEEAEAISKTIEVLQGDEARTLLANTVSFLQESIQSTGAEQAGAVLMQAGQRLGNQQLVTLGLTSKRDSLAKVKEEIDKLIADLKKQQSGEVAQRDTCVDNLEKNNLTTDEKENFKAHTEDKIQALRTQVKECVLSLKELNSDVAEMNKQVGVASETRQKENTAFQAEIENEKATQAILKKAVAFLQNYYGKGVSGERTHLVQIHSHAPGDDAELGAPEGFKEYSKNSGGLGAVTLIETIIEDSQKAEAEATEDESLAQKEYEEFTQRSAAGIKANMAAIETKTKEKAEAESDLADEESNRESALEELDGLQNTMVDLHKQCDFFLLNFDVRQTARSQEMQALAEAKGIIGGANYGK